MIPVRHGNGQLPVTYDSKAALSLKIGAVGRSWEASLCFAPAGSDKPLHCKGKRSMLEHLPGMQE